MRIGVIGLGNVGGAAAANLVEDGREVVVFDAGRGDRDWSDLLEWMEQRAKCRLELRPQPE